MSGERATAAFTASAPAFKCRRSRPSPTAASHLEMLEAHRDQRFIAAKMRALDRRCTCRRVDHGRPVGAAGSAASDDGGSLGAVSAVQEGGAATAEGQAAEDVGASTRGRAGVAGRRTERESALHVECRRPCWETDAERAE